MHKSILSLGLAITICSANANAQPPRPDGDHHGPPRNPLMHLLDANHDQEITFAEIEQAIAKLKEQDSDGDNKLSGEELKALPGPPRHGRGGPGERGMRDRGPRDRGPGDRGPRDRGPRDRGPGDRGPGDRGPGDRGPGDSSYEDRGPEGGRIGNRERGRGGPGGRGGLFGFRGRGDGERGADLVGRLLAFDKNEDGKLAEDEVPGRMQRMIQGADADQDGFIDKSEIAKMVAKIGGKLGDQRDADKDQVSDTDSEPGDRKSARYRRDNDRKTDERSRPEGHGDGKGRADRRAPGGPRGFGGPPSPERMVEHAFEFDADGNGSLSKSEFGEFAKHLAQRRRPGGGPPGGGRPDRDNMDRRPDRPQRPE